MKLQKFIMGKNEVFSWKKEDDEEEGGMDITCS